MTPEVAPMRCTLPSRSTTAPITFGAAPSLSVINSVIGASSHSGMPCSVSANRIRAISDWPMAAIRSPRTCARTIR